MLLKVYLLITVQVYVTEIISCQRVARSGSALFPLLNVGHYMPSANQMKIKKLIRRLGRHFDPEFMSIENPDFSNNVVGAEKAEHENNLFSGQSRDIIRWLNQHNLESGISNQTLHQMAELLGSISSCRVKHEWDELGSLFFPRFVRTGSCVSQGSCSWPPGMTCKPGREKKVRILRWQCKRKRSISNNQRHKNRTKGGRTKGSRKRPSRVGIVDKVKCNWKLIPWEVTLDCICSC